MDTANSHEHGAGHDDDHGESHGHGDHPKFLAHHFDTPLQQFDTAKLGMWLFLAQELLFFAGLFVAYGIYRNWYPDAFSWSSHQLDPIMGAINTVVLLFSSLTAALAVRSSQLGQKSKTSMWLVLTIICAFIFLVVKYFEYEHKFESGLLPGGHFHPHHLHVVRAMHGAAAAGIPDHSGTFFGIYFMMTGVHGLHVLIGIGVMIWILIRNNRGEFSAQYFTPVELVALYWHLVDLIWIYLFPLLYLID
ncbi:MAG: cytochrome c oxidase subunit 3 family protein [Sandaracinaceae bacterium]|nr:cytochrome c oxidase subunit 3 family protein [Sandaracinaceae bacterium]